MTEMNLKTITIQYNRETALLELHLCVSESQIKIALFLALVQKCYKYAELLLWSSLVIKNFLLRMLIWEADPPISIEILQISIYFCSAVY